MSPKEIKAVRYELGCTTKELARALGVDAATIGAWEQGELFPTKRFVQDLTALRARGPDAIPRTVKRPGPSAMTALADPGLWALFRKIVAHPDLRREAASLASAYPDPADENP